VENIHAPDLRIRFFLLSTSEKWKVLVSFAFFLLQIFRTFYTEKTSLGRIFFSVCHVALPSLPALPWGSGRNLGRS
jgi:hypothetical protein